jgi:CRP-like cAMP-binding protein
MNIISRSTLFNGLPEDQIRKISEIVSDKHFKKGTTVFFEGDDGNGFYLIHTGMVKIYKASPGGKEQILHILGPGEPFGEVPVFSGRQFPANAEAIAESHVLFFPRTAFVNLISINPSLSLNMLAVLSLRLRQFTLQIENLSLKEVPGRLAGYLMYLSSKQEERRLILLDISKVQLASLLGTIPETLSRIFSKMSDQGLIEVDGRQIRILDSDRLARLASDGKSTML